MRIVAIVAVGLMALMFATAVVVVGTEAAEAQASDTTVRIVARKLSDGRVEFGIQTYNAQDDAWGENQLPSRRFFSARASVGRWLSSSSLGSGAGALRITARKIADGRIEFALQQRRGSDSWGAESCRPHDSSRPMPTSGAGYDPCPSNSMVPVAV